MNHPMHSFLILAGLLIGAPPTSAQCDSATMTGEPTQLALNEGGVQKLLLETCPRRAGQVYMVLGSFSGTRPGTELGGGMVLPLNPDWYMRKTLLSPNRYPLFYSLGVLDVNGAAEPRFWLAPGAYPELAGEVVNHAAVVFDSALRIDLVSNPQALDLVARF